MMSEFFFFNVLFLLRWSLNIVFVLLTGGVPE